MNNPSLDRLMMEAAAAAYNVSLLNPSDLINRPATLTGSDPNGIAYQVDSGGYVQNTLLGAYGYKIEAGFDDTSTGFSAVILSRVKADGTKDWIVSFNGTDFSSPTDKTTILQLGWNQWKSPSNQGGQALLEYLRSKVNTNDTINFTGHSLGGGLAEYAAYYTQTELLPQLRENNSSFNLNLSLTTFNSMGVLDGLQLYAGADAGTVNTAVEGMQVTHYIRQGDLVGLLGGHVGDTVSTTNGIVSNVYELGTNTLFLTTAHVLSTLYQENLYNARNYNPDYLTIRTTKRLINTIVALDTQGITDPKQMLGVALQSLLNSLKDGEPYEINAFARWIINNFKDSGKINAPVHAALIGIDWADQIRNGVLGSESFYAAIRGEVVAWNILTDTLTKLGDWTGVNVAIDVIRTDVQRFIKTLETYIAPTNRGTPPALELIDWLDSGYDFTAVLTQAQGYAEQLATNPDALKTAVEADPLSFLPVLTAPNRSDYSNDPAGDTAYQTALDLYNQKLSERNQVETLYNQYVSETNALNLLPRNSGALGQTVINGGPGLSPDILTADLNTTTIYGLAGNDDLAGMAGVDGFTPGIHIYGGTGNDVLTGEYHFGGWSASLSPEGSYRGLYNDIGPDAFAALYGRVKPGEGAYLYGEEGQDQLLGSLLDDTLDGGDDADVLHGDLGDDTLTGGTGNDIVNGDQSQDDVEGNDGIDLLGGGAGADHLQGGLEADRIYGDSRYLSPFGGWDGINYTLAQGINGLIEVIPIVKDAPEVDVLLGGTGEDMLRRMIFRSPCTPLSQKLVSVGAAAYRRAA